MIDASSIRRFADALRSAAETMDVDIRTPLHAAANLVADEARARVAPYSSKVTIGTQDTGPITVAVTAGGTPMAGLLERGNKGGTTTPTSFRHPVYGTETNWVAQPAHPYLRRSLAAKSVEITELFGTDLEGKIHTICVESEG